MTLKASITFVLVLSISFLKAQEKPRTPFNLAFKGAYGFIIPHSESIKAVSDTYPFGLEADLSWQLVGEKTWQSFASYPRVGFTAGYTNFANPSVLGNAYTFVPYFEPFLNAQNRFNISFRMGVGWVYLDNVYDEIGNPTNLFFSSPISALLYMNLHFNYRLSPHWALRLAGCYNHISNGGIREPNKGINYPMLSLGVEYTWKPFDFRSRKKTDWRTLYPDRDSWNLALFGTATNVSPGEDQRYLIMGLHGYYKKIFGRLSAFRLGVEWVNDGASAERMRRENIEESHQKLSFIGGHELLLGRFSFSQEIGVYFFNKQPNQKSWYQRYGLTYHVKPKLFVGFNLKSHLEVADFFDLRVGTVF